MIDTVKVADVTIKEQTRKDLGDLTGLKASIARIGVLNPVVLKNDDGTWVLVAGERRLRAAMELGLAEVPFVTRENGQLLEVQVAENLHRKDLTPLEEAQAVLALSQDMTVKQVAEATNIKPKQQATLKKRAKAVAELVDDEAYDTLNMFTAQGIDDVLGVDVSFIDAEAQALARARIVQYMAGKNISMWSARGELVEEQRQAQWDSVIVPIIKTLRIEKKGNELEDKKSEYEYAMKAPRVGPQARILSDEEAQDHYDESCFAYWVHEDKYILRYYCRNWLRHAESGQSELKSEDATQEFEDKQARSEFNKAQRDEVAAKREVERRFVTEKRTKKVLATWAWELAANDLSRSRGSYEQLRKLLGIAPKKHEYGSNDDEGAVRDWCADTGTDHGYLMVAFAALRVVQGIRDPKSETAKTWAAEAKELEAIAKAVAKENQST